MFDGVDLDVALGKRRGTVRFGNVFHAGLDFRPAIQIHAAETHAAAGGRRQNRHIDSIPTVQADPGKTGGMIESLLIEHARLNKTSALFAR